MLISQFWSWVHGLVRRPDIVQQLVVDGVPTCRGHCEFWLAAFMSLGDGNGRPRGGGRRLLGMASNVPHRWLGNHMTGQITLFPRRGHCGFFLEAIYINNEAHKRNAHKGSSNILWHLSMHHPFCFDVSWYDGTLLCRVSQRSTTRGPHTQSTHALSGHDQRNHITTHVCGTRPGRP